MLTNECSSYLPPKLQEAINAELNPECTPEAVSLHSHLHKSHGYIKSGYMPDRALTCGDRSVIQILLNSENARQPELKLSYYSSLAAFASWLVANKNMGKQHVRAVVCTA